LPVSYASGNTAVRPSRQHGDDGGRGTTLITAAQAGNSNYRAAAAVSQMLTVNKAAAA